ncbi:MAG: dephospho-CoA kinase [Clostridia bacterium]|nr:dephospho-CoA kinase [Clostridia bacterium]
MKPFVVGLTGGIASGKSAVSNRLGELGFEIVDTDVISREVIAPGTQGEKLLKTMFPFAFVDGKFDRKIMREATFSDENLREKLNAITHPLIFNAVNNKIQNSSAPIIILVVPLMFETGSEKQCDFVVTVSADEKTRINRVMERNNSITEEIAKAIIASQMSDSERNARADKIIYNDGTRGELDAQVEELYYEIKRRASEN